MKAEYGNAVNEALENAPEAVRKAFFKQVGLLVENLHHPSLHAKKYDESNDRWQARVNRNWRFYFRVIGSSPTWGAKYQFQKIALSD